MKHYAYLIGLLLILAGCAGSPGIYSEETRTFSNEKYGFSIKAPEGWEKKTVKGYDIGFASGRGMILIKRGNIKIKNRQSAMKDLLAVMERKAPDRIKKTRKDRATINYQYRVQEEKFFNPPFLISQSARFFNRGNERIGRLSQEFLVLTRDGAKLFNIFFIIEITGKPSNSRKEAFRREYNILIDSFLGNYRKGR